MTKADAQKKLIALARSQVGYKEGANNFNKYAADPRITRLYGWDVQYQPWCCVFANWCFMEAFGEETGRRMTCGGSAACSNQADLYRGAGRFASTPEPGDQIFFNVSGGINHTGIVIEVSGSNVKTVEGNYSDGVGIGSYIMGSPRIAGYGRPDWSLAAEIPADAPAEPGEPVSGTDTEKPKTQQTCRAELPILHEGDEGVAVERLQTLLIARGYYCGGRRYGGREAPDGEFGPATAVAVRDVQLAAKIKRDGVVGADTWAALIRT